MGVSSPQMFARNIKEEGKRVQRCARENSALGRCVNFFYSECADAVGVYLAAIAITGVLIVA